jgi:hypothetical protein
MLWSEELCVPGSPYRSPRPASGNQRHGGPDAYGHEPRMWCLTLATNAIVCWMTEYHERAITALREQGRRVDDAAPAHIWPTHHTNVHFYGTHSVDVAGELAQLEVDG